MSCVPSAAFYAEVRSKDQQNWLRLLNACNKGKLTFSPVHEVVYYEQVRVGVGCSYSPLEIRSEMILCLVAILGLVFQLYEKVIKQAKLV